VNKKKNNELFSFKKNKINKTNVVILEKILSEKNIKKRIMPI
jgi:hypothetical protein